jgi:hypothetical protein
VLCLLVLGGAAEAASGGEEESVQTSPSNLQQFQDDNRGRELAWQQANLARHDARRGDRASAVLRLQRALELAGQIRAIGKRTVALVQIATIQAEVGDHEGALRTTTAIESLTERDSTLRTIALDRARAGDLESAKRFAAAIQDTSKKTEALTYIDAQLSARPLGY